MKREDDPEVKAFGIIAHLDPDAVGRIVAAVSVPANIDRQALLADLEGALNIYRTGVVLRERPVKREQMVARIVRAAEDLRDGLLLDYIAKYGALRLSRHRVALSRLLEDLREEGKDSPGLNRIIGFKQSMQISAFDQLVGGLAEIFGRHYNGIKAGYTITIDTINQPGGEVRGHFIDFAYAALIESGIYAGGGDPDVPENKRKPTPYTRKAIATALSKVRPKP